MLEYITIDSDARAGFLRRIVASVIPKDNVKDMSSTNRKGPDLVRFQNSFSRDASGKASKEDMETSRGVEAPVVGLVWLMIAFGCHQLDYLRAVLKGWVPFRRSWVIADIEGPCAKI